MKKRKSFQSENKQNANRSFKWLWTIFSIIIVILTIYFFSTLLKWILPLLILLLLLADSGAENIKESIIAILLIVTASLLAWFFIVSPEYKAGMAAYDKGEYTAAIKHFDTELKKDSAQPDVLLARCKAMGKAGHPKQALPDCNSAMSLGNDDTTESYASRARIYNMLGMYRKSWNDFTVAIQQYEWSSSENLWYLLYERSLINLEMDRNDDAIDDLKNAYRLNEEWYPVWLPMGNAYFNKGEREKALQAYEKYMLHYDLKEDKLSGALKQRIMNLRKSTFQKE